MRIARVLFATVWVAACSSGSADGQASPDRAVVLATTTSTEDTGLLDRLIPQFEGRSGLTVKTVAVGTGQALEMGRRGEADVLLVHAPARELEFVKNGHGRNRRAVMHNDFVIVGPAADPAGIGGGRDAAAAFRQLAEKRAAFVSRGDGSGTHTKEQALFAAAGVEAAGDWYIEAGQGMGATLRIADGKRAYTLTDRSTLLATANLELQVLVEGDSELENPYHVIEVVGARVNSVGAAALARFFVAQEAQGAIAGFKLEGRQLFVPDALE
jgi:tungstate transport system substrate-binding protein